MSVGFVKLCLDVTSKRMKIVVLMNFLFFGCVFVAVLLAQFMFPSPFYSGWSPAVPEIFLESNWLVMVLGIFVFNLVISAFLVVTLPGMVFFLLSVVALLYRAFLWGLLVYALPTWLFLAVLPTLVLEGEAYVFAGVAGTVVGVSWVKPNFLFHEEALSRREGFKRALKECLRLYVFIVVILFVAAVVETATIILIGQF